MGSKLWGPWSLRKSLSTRLKNVIRTFPAVPAFKCGALTNWTADKRGRRQMRNDINKGLEQVGTVEHPGESFGIRGCAGPLS